MPRFRRRGFRVRGPRGPVSVTRPTLRKKTKCAACKQELPAGSTAAVLRLRKAYAGPCTGCGRKPVKKRSYHEHCLPSDINAAMGVDPNCTPRPSTGGAVAPPPIPPTPEELSLAALAQLEAALVARAARKGVTEQLEKEFKTYQGIKARVLRPGTPAEGEVALSVALQRLIKLVF